mgnify:CR=1 FL=1
MEMVGLFLQMTIILLLSVEQFEPVTKNFCSNNLDLGLFAVIPKKNGSI